MGTNLHVRTVFLATAKGVDGSIEGYRSEENVSNYSKAVDLSKFVRIETSPTL